ncbi:MAG TPA: hypothetical protein PKH77_01660 [Anaerolineae bacterium]|nr:hypothetical protein [Anaerolineae bacterium]
MSLHKKDIYLDNLLRQAMQPYARVQPSRAVWRRIYRRVCEPQMRWYGWFSWLWRPFTVDGRLTYLPYDFGSTRGYAPSPFLGVMVKQMLDLRLAS